MQKASWKWDFQYIDFKTKKINKADVKFGKKLSMNLKFETLNTIKVTVDLQCALTQISKKVPFLTRGSKKKKMGLKIPNQD